MKRIALVLFALMFTPMALAFAQTPIGKTYNHAAQYQVATLDRNLRVATGYDVTLGKSQTDNKLDAGGQGIHLLHTDAGDFRVEAPVNKGLSILSALVAASANNGYAAQTFHNRWFLDTVPSGTKVLFAAGCARPGKKHPNETVRCQFWFPDPDSSNHEYATLGDFTPYITGNGSNMQNTANVLCGTGKLNAATEAQICAPIPAASVPDSVSAAEARQLADAAAETKRLQTYTPVQSAVQARETSATMPPEVQAVKAAAPAAAVIIPAVGPPLVSAPSSVATGQSSRPNGHDLVPAKTKAPVKAYTVWPPQPQ